MAAAGVVGLLVVRRGLDRPLRWIQSQLDAERVLLSEQKGVVQDRRQHRFLRNIDGGLERGRDRDLVVHEFGRHDQRDVVNRLEDVVGIVVIVKDVATHPPVVLAHDREMGPAVHGFDLGVDCGAADAHRRDGRIDPHLAGVRDVAGEEPDRPLNHGQKRRVVVALGVIDHVVEHHPRVRIERESGAVKKG